MRDDITRSGAAGRASGARLENLPLDRRSWDKAWTAFMAEDYEASLTSARHCLDAVGGSESPNLGPVNLVPDPGVPTVRDCVLLCARNLYHLDRFDEFEMLQASAGRWGMIPERMPELDAVEMSFACKRGEYVKVVEEATAFIDKHRRSLPPVIADFLYLRGLARSHLGDPEQAREDAEAAYSLFRVLERPFDGARTANLMGILQFRSARYDRAGDWFRRALDLHERLGMRKNMGGNRLNMGICCYKRGDFAEAMVEFRAATRLLEDVDAEVSLCRAAIAQGNTHRLLREFRQARKRLLQAYEDASRLRLSREEALALEFLGDVCLDEDQVDKARRYYSRALAIGRSIAPEGDVVMEVLRRQGQCLVRLGRMNEALTVLGRALTLARRQGDRCEEGVIRRTLCEALLGLGDLESAAEYIQQSAQLLEEVGARYELALTQVVLASVQMARLDSGLVADQAELLDEAWHAAMSALDCFLKVDVDQPILTTRRLLTSISRRRVEEDPAVLIPPSAVDTDRVGEPVRAAGPIVHVSACMRDLIQLADAFADSGEPVLVSGATGTGKEVFARRLHDKSGRRAKKLVCVNVAAIPDGVFDREFFGHVRGSFSGAERDGIGLAAQADGGTLFLDEIGELPLELQPKLLRLLQDGTYQAIGDPAERRVNIRLVAATNADLQDLVATGRFRADLYYRLKILELKLPPITQRREDILPLLGHFLCESAGRRVEIREFFNPTSIEAMQHYDWPGNVREIAMVARQAMVQLASRGRVCVEVGLTTDDAVFFAGPLPAGLEMEASALPHDEMGRSRILLALAEAEGNRAKAARRLGVSRSTLYRRMEKLGIAGR